MLRFSVEMTSVILVVFVLANALLTLAQPATAFSPPTVKRGRTTFFSALLGEKFDVKKSMENTLKNKVNVWFKVSSFNVRGVEQSLWYIDWDAERKPFTKIVIHHSETNPVATSQEIDEIGLQRLYKPRYLSNNPDPYVKGLPINSNHILATRDPVGDERFIGYHHLVYQDGKVTTELQPLVNLKDQWFIDMVGWHADNWEVNCESVAICLVGQYADRKPLDKQLEALTKLIGYYQRFNPRLTIHPHKEFSSTKCPGSWWDEWKK